ncbi:hypothetical protein NDI89_03835 [Natrinema sp. S1CR25-10]|uniref:Uncharacterized protein n=1 Tax=Natrinema salsiterrestre TaxID=2950540 RepID=A0A9Q4KZY0_9EURY|nr:hypothetical protein [Natrinema salsiterrestre]MDF9744709.1 hypothetical protein [Natrinema salsiterrestre]
MKDADGEVQEVDSVLTRIRDRVGYIAPFRFPVSSDYSIEVELRVLGKIAEYFENI